MQKTVTLTKKQAAKDSEIFGVIMTGIKTSKKQIRQSQSSMENSTSFCAIGAGNRGRKVTRAVDVFNSTNPNDDSDTTLHQLIPMIRFSTANDVSENYACGVNDGFEDSTTASKSFYKKVDMESLDYLRGYAVGAQIREEAGI